MKVFKNCGCFLNLYSQLILNLFTKACEISSRARLSGFLTSPMTLSALHSDMSRRSNSRRMVMALMWSLVRRDAV